MFDPVEEAIPSFEMLPILYLSSSCKVPEDVNVQQQDYEYLKPSKFDFGSYGSNICLILTPSLHVPTGGMIMKLYIGGLYQNVPASLIVVKIEQKTNTTHQQLYTLITISPHLRD